MPTARAVPIARHRCRRTASRTAPAQARADRTYQIAAARFYSGQFAEAEAAFTAIARDPASPWRAMAPYLAARAIVRQATLGGPKGEGDPTAFARALTAVNTILRDGTRQEAHEPARRLRQFIVNKTQPRDVLIAAATDLSSPVHADRFAERLTDLDYISRRIVTSPNEFAPEANDAPLLDWMFTLQADGDEALVHALDRWDRSRQTPWLMTVMVKLPPDHPRQAELLAVASAVPSSAPAYATIAFHTARLLLRSARVTEARVVLDQAIGVPALPSSTVNLFKAARLLTARTLNEFLADAARERVVQPAADERATFVRSVNDVLDRDSLGVLNQLPVDLARRAGTSAALPPVARRALTLSAFTRVLLIDDLQTAREMLPEVALAAPSLAIAIARLDTADDQRLRDEAALLMLRTPGLAAIHSAVEFSRLRGGVPQGRQPHGARQLPRQLVVLDGTARPRHALLLHSSTSIERTTGGTVTTAAVQRSNGSGGAGFRDTRRSSSGGKPVAGAAADRRRSQRTRAPRDRLGTTQSRRPESP